MQPKFKILYDRDGLYTVYERHEVNDVFYTDLPQFTGSLADCEAFVRLAMSDDIEFNW